MPFRAYPTTSAFQDATPSLGISSNTFLDAAMSPPLDVHQAGANLVAHACTWWPQVGGRHAQATEMMCGLGRNPQREHEKSVNARPGWGSTRSETRAVSVSVYKETSYVRRTRHTEMSTWAWSCLARRAEIGQRRAMTIVVSARRS
jgi:hypothetical protein